MIVVTGDDNHNYLVCAHALCFVPFDSPNSIIRYVFWVMLHRKPFFITQPRLLLIYSSPSSIIILFRSAHSRNVWMQILNTPIRFSRGDPYYKSGTYCDRHLIKELIKLVLVCFFSMLNFLCFLFIYLFISCSLLCYIV